MTEETIDYYRKELQRAAWRISYRQRIYTKKERLKFENSIMNCPAEPCVYEAERTVREYVELIPFDKGRHVMKSLFLDGKTEAETAKVMQISQQGVSKWKRKSLEYLRRTLNS